MQFGSDPFRQGLAVPKLAQTSWKQRQALGAPPVVNSFDVHFSVAPTEMFQYGTRSMKKMPEKRLTSPSQAEIVTLAVYRLGGAQRAIDTEDAAVEAHRIAPGRFSWKKYPDQINLELIRVFLSDAKKNKLVVGSGRTG